MCRIFSQEHKMCLFLIGGGVGPGNFHFDTVASLLARWQHCITYAEAYILQP